MLLDEDWTLEIVPVDHVANLVMAAGWQNGTEWITRNTNGTQRGLSNPGYNNTSSLFWPSWIVASYYCIVTNLTYWEHLYLIYHPICDMNNLIRSIMSPYHLFNTWSKLCEISSHTTICCIWHMQHIVVWDDISHNFDHVLKRNHDTLSCCNIDLFLQSKLFKYYNKTKTSKHLKYSSPVKMCYRLVHMSRLYMYSIQYDNNYCPN